MRIYADTSVFGGMFDSEFKEPSQAFFVEVDSGRFTLITSAIVEAEIEPAPQRIRQFFTRYLEVAEVINPTQETIKLQQAYVVRRGHREVSRRCTSRSHCKRCAMRLDR